MSNFNFNFRFQIKGYRKMYDDKAIRAGMIGFSFPVPILC